MHYGCKLIYTSILAAWRLKEVCKWQKRWCHAYYIVWFRWHHRLPAWHARYNIFSIFTQIHVCFQFSVHHHQKHNHPQHICADLQHINTSERQQAIMFFLLEQLSSRSWVNVLDTIQYIVWKQTLIISYARERKRRQSFQWKQQSSG